MINIAQKKSDIKEVIVVEGKSDTNKLKSIFNVDTIETNGSALNQKTINLIKKINETRGVILFLDPDYSGEKIRKKIVDSLPNCKQAFLLNQNKNNHAKNGLAEANKESIIRSLNNIVTFQKNFSSISWNDYLNLNLFSKIKRLYLCEKLKISYCNHKQLFKRLNLMNINKQKINLILKDFSC